MNNEEKILEILFQIQKDQSDMRADITGMKSDISGLKTEVADMKSDISGLKTEVADMKSDISGLKTEVADMKSDISGLKTEVAGMKSEVADMNQRLRKVEVTQETAVVGSLQLLAEGHITIQNQIKGLSVIDSMQDDIATLKNAVRFLSDKVEKMEVKMEKDQDQEKAG